MQQQKKKKVDVVTMAANAARLAAVQATKPLSRDSQRVVDALTIDARATRARMAENPPKFSLATDAINAAGTEMNALQVEPGPVAVESLDLAEKGESTPRWVN